MNESPMSNNAIAKDLLSDLKEFTDSRNRIEEILRIALNINEESK